MKSREFWIEFAGDPDRDSERNVRYVSLDCPKWVAPDEECIHVRTADPAFDALVLEMVEVLEEIRSMKVSVFVDDVSELVETRETLQSIRARGILAKYDAYARDEKK